MRTSSTPSPAQWRAMRETDLEAAHALAKRVHAGYPERPDVAAERLRLAPGWCRILEDAGGATAGYIVAHPWRLFAPPALDALLGGPAAEPDTLYLHDIVIAPERRGAGDAREGLKGLFADAAARYPSASLVSIGGLGPYWERWGFAVRERTDLLAILATYDPDARYMVRAFDSAA